MFVMTDRNKLISVVKAWESEKTCLSFSVYLEHITT